MRPIVGVLVIFICCTYAAPLKNELLQRAAALDTKIKAEIKKLQVEKKEHLALLLEEEEKRMETLVNRLKEVSDSDIVKTAIIEQELITMEYRVETELNRLQRESETQDFLIASANRLKEWVTEKLKVLENIGEPHKQQAERAAQVLKREERRLEEIVQELTKAQDQRIIERLEVELRAMEIRLYRALEEINSLTRTTVHPATGTTKAHVTSTHKLTTTHTSLKPTSPKPSTAKHVTTQNPIQLKAVLMKKATELENYATSEIAKLKKENKTALAKGLQSLELEVKEVTAKLQKTSVTEILELIESELYWLERRLAIETEALVQQEKRVEKLLAIAVALKTRIDSSIQLLAKTPYGKALEAEAKKLEKVSTNLKTAKDEKTIINLEIELATIEKRVDDELRPIGVPTTKKF